MLPPNSDSSKRVFSQEDFRPGFAAPIKLVVEGFNGNVRAGSGLIMGRKNSQIDTGPKEDLDKRLKEMNKRLGRDVQKLDDGKPNKPDSAGYGNAFRLSSEFISAILVGTAIGYGIDWIFGTLPLAMIVFLLLGFVAGIKNVLRAAGETTNPQKGDGEPQNESKVDKN